MENEVDFSAESREEELTERSEVHNLSGPEFERLAEIRSLQNNDSSIKVMREYLELDTLFDDEKTSRKLMI